MNRKFFSWRHAAPQEWKVFSSARPKPAPVSGEACFRLTCASGGEEDFANNKKLDGTEDNARENFPFVEARTKHVERQDEEKLISSRGIH